MGGGVGNGHLQVYEDGNEDSRILQNNADGGMDQASPSHPPIPSNLPAEGNNVAKKKGNNIPRGRSIAHDPITNHQEQGRPPLFGY